MIKFFEKLLNLIYIQPCYFCGSKKEDGIICPHCYRKIHFMPPAVLKEQFDSKIYACCLYDEITKKLIKDLKYHNKKILASLQAKIMYEYWQQLDIKGEFIILPVPIHKNRLKERKYNHMDITADELSRLTNFEVNKNFLLRIKDTEKQFKLHKKERIKNIKNAFDINKDINIKKDTKLLIIDDITSTGITLEEIIKLLKRNGYNNITALTTATPDIWN
ncbi:MAG: ComF family protein [Candidatus Gastranaerophilales bacterium]|nr:ComF family protein [Candidatus Gastranaerophilales bacterium]